MSEWMNKWVDEWINEFDGRENIQVETNESGRIVMLQTKMGSLGMIN